MPLARSIAPPPPSRTHTPRFAPAPNLSLRAELAKSQEECWREQDHGKPGSGQIAPECLEKAEEQAAGRAAKLGRGGGGGKRGVVEAGS